MATKNSKPFIVSSAIPSLPHEILVSNIFVRLPVRSVIYCKSVCKQWHQLLTDPYFIAMHYKRQKLHNHQNILCGPILCITYIKACCSVNSEFLNGVFYSLHLQSTALVPVRLPGFPNILKNYTFCRTVGYCNGILCLVVRDDATENQKKNKHLFFGNPSTGDYKVLPERIHIPFFIGFTYDSSLDDYICVMIDNITRNPHIYSLKSNSWRIDLGSSDNNAIEWTIGFPYNVGAVLDGSIYWVNNASNYVVEYSYKDGEFRQLALPTEMSKSSLCIKVVEKSVCVINVWVRGTCAVDRLMLKQEENNKKSKCCCWSKLMSVNLYDLFPVFKLNLLSLTRDGKFLCHVVYGVSDDSFVLIDPETGRTEDLTARDESGGDWFEEHTFLESHMGYIDTFISPN